jgi:hypothetical protein
MLKNKVPLYDLSFWWLQRGLGILLPSALTVAGIYSIVTHHAYFISRNQPYYVPLRGEQAVLIGVAYIGIAVMLFANCYAPYHQKMGFYDQWLLALGAVLAGGGILWCCWISWASAFQ